MSKSAISWLETEKSVMRPAERIHPAEWIPRRVKLPEDSFIRGYCDLDLIRQFRPLLDWIIDDNIDEIYLCSSSQSGKTTVILACIAYIVKQRRWSAGVVMADQTTTENISEKRWAPAWENDEVLCRDIDFSHWTQTYRGFIGGHSVKFAWASSVAGTASWSAGIVYADEIDKPGYSLASKEGDKLFYIKQRLESYWGAKFIASSTPTDEDGNITAVQRQKDVLVFDIHIPCPHCGQFQPLRFSREYSYGFTDGQYRAEDGELHPLGHVVWEGGRRATIEEISATARYCCGECQGYWTTIEKNRAIMLGKPVPRTVPAGQRKYYLHNNRLTSLFKGGRIERLVEDFVSLMNNENRFERDRTLQAWVQNALAEPFKRVVIEVRASRVELACCARGSENPGYLPPQTVPPEAIALECTVDVQKSGRWFRVRAWSRDTTSWLIHYGLLSGWSDVEDLFFGTTYPVMGSDRRMGLWRAAVDIGGTKLDLDEVDGGEAFSMTEDTMLWLYRNQRRGLKIWGTKGSSHPLGVKCKVGSNIDKTPSGKPLPGGVQIVLLDTDVLKEAFFYRLALAIKREPQGAYLHSIPDGAENDKFHAMYNSHISAEEKRKDPKTGKEAWVKLRSRNDLLDCEAAGLALVDPSWPAGGLNMLHGPVFVTGALSGASSGGDRSQTHPQVLPGSSPSTIGHGAFRGRTVNPNFGRRLV